MGSNNASNGTPTKVRPIEKVTVLLVTGDTDNYVVAVSMAPKLDGINILGKFWCSGGSVRTLTFVSIFEPVDYLGYNVSAMWLVLHVFTGNDEVPKTTGKSKDGAIKAFFKMLGYTSLDDVDAMRYALTQLGQKDYTIKDLGGFEFGRLCNGLEQFYLLLHNMIVTNAGTPSTASLDEERHKQYLSNPKKDDFGNLILCHRQFQMHVLRCNYSANQHIGAQLERPRGMLEPHDRGWMLDSTGCPVILWHTGALKPKELAPKKCCSCRKGNCTACGCVTQRTTCTPLCACATSGKCRNKAAGPAAAGPAVGSAGV